MPAKYTINSEDFEEYLAVLARCSEVPMDDDLKLMELLRSYAELKFRTIGGSKCGVCRAHVRHVVPVVSCQPGGERKNFDCLCTRCFEAEKATAERMFLQIGDNRVEVRLRADDLPASTAAALPGPSTHKPQ